MISHNHRQPNRQQTHLPFGGFRTGASYTAEITGRPAPVRTQIEFDPTTSGTDPITNGSVRAVLAAIPAVCAADPGLLVDDARPRYRHHHPR